jgi:hypothetical protein
LRPCARMRRLITSSDRNEERGSSPRFEPQHHVKTSTGSATSEGWVEPSANGWDGNQTRRPSIIGRNERRRQRVGEAQETFRPAHAFISYQLPVQCLCFSNLQSRLDPVLRWQAARDQIFLLSVVLAALGTPLPRTLTWDMLQVEEAACETEKPALPKPFPALGSKEFAR